MFSLPTSTVVKVSETFGDITLDAGATFPCVISLYLPDRSSSNEVIFINKKLRASVLQPPALLEEDDCVHVVGFTDHREEFHHI
jgi:hypothetical protein